MRTATTVALGALALGFGLLAAALNAEVDRLRARHCVSVETLAIAVELAKVERQVNELCTALPLATAPCLPCPSLPTR